MNNRFIMTCGLPGTGKSTWARKKYHTENDYFISSDDYMELLADGYNLTYNDVFNDITYAFCERMMYSLAKMCFDRNRKVIWDQTNLTVKSRKRKLDIVPPNYIKTAIVFNVPPDHIQRLNDRAKTQGKVIPLDVIERMAARFVRPSFAEGFDEIVEVTT